MPRAPADGALRTDLCDELDAALDAAWQVYAAEQAGDDPGDYETPLTQSW